MGIRMRMKALALMGGLIMVGLASVMSQDVGAATVPRGSELEQKMMYQGVYKCYDEGAMRDSFGLDEYIGASSLLSNKEVSVPLITSADNSTGGLKCEDLLGDGGSAFKMTNKIPPVRSDSNAEAIETFVRDMGYDIKDSSSDSKCFALHYYYKMTDEKKSPEQTTNMVCQEDTGLKTYSLNSERNVFGVGSGAYDLCFVGATGYSDFAPDKYCKTVGGDGLDGAFLESVIETSKCRIGGGDSGGKCFLKFFNGVNIYFTDVYPTAPLNKMKAGKSSDASETAIKFLSESKYKNLQDIKILDDENHLDERVLYQSYLANYYHVGVDCENGTGDKVWWIDKDNVVRECYYTKSSLHVDDRVVGVDNDGFLDEKILLKDSDIVKALNGMRREGYSGDAIAPYADYIAAGFNTSGLNNGSSILEDCENSGAAKSLGWIVCPILGLMSDAANSIYTDYVEPSLQVSPSLFDDNGDYGVGDAWGIFRNIANVLFAILFLVVIFSQLTGVGIDNYGIKKILPKLILSAILINLSYLICVICVDLSNIIGNGLQSMFDGFSNQIRFDGNSELDSATTGEAITAVVLLAGAGGVFAAVLNPAILLALLVSALGVVISILFLFVLLAGRKAVIIVLLVIAPLAIICYILPNTKKYFDKWLNIWKVMLFLYPICGLLVGGGNFVSKLFLSVGAIGPFEAITAMIIGVLPIFFIPNYVKSAISALGTLGSKISGFGDRMQGSATKAMRSSSAYKNMQEMGMNRKIRMKAGMDKNGNLTTVGRAKARLAGTKFGKMIGAETRLARYGSQTKKNISEQETAGAILTGALAQKDIANAESLENGELTGSGFKAGTEGAYYGRKFLDAANAGDFTRMNSIIQAMKNSNMKPKDIAKLIRYAQSSGQIKGDKDVLADWKGRLFSQYGNDFLATDAELSHYMMTRGKFGNITMEYGGYAKSDAMNIDDISPESIPKLSGDSMAGLVSAGLLTQGMAQRVLASRPNISEDKKIMLSAVANGMVGEGTVAAQLKSDAEALMKNHGAGSIGGTSVGKDTVDAWVANNPVEANVVQNFSAGGKQFGPVQTTGGEVRLNLETGQPYIPPRDSGGK